MMRVRANQNTVMRVSIYWTISDRMPYVKLSSEYILLFKPYNNPAGIWTQISMTRVQVPNNSIPIYFLPQKNCLLLCKGQYVLLWINNAHPKKCLQSLSDFSGEGAVGFFLTGKTFWISNCELLKLSVSLKITKYTSCRFLIIPFLHQGACFHFFRNTMVFHFNIAETYIFSAGLYLMSSWRVTEWNTEDTVSGTCTGVYKFSSGWVSVPMAKLSLHSLNLVVCSLNGIMWPYKSTSATSLPFFLSFCTVTLRKGKPLSVYHIFDGSSNSV